ncbi:hypothetical protein [uncultured Duncaniella sp.]|uniref:hypothetical protein n=1 Tax=uncultured Duncaniella sp. TaxID=2768039 RepID=UPI002674BA2A|nr:hypothetical protein [uncultured Duncaniella sp.]MCI9173295.1 hypothetical protein [Muribaculaceae bacterium]
MKRALKITEVLRPLDSEQCQCYLSNALQVADVLEYVLAFTGPADVDMTSFSLSEEFLRRLYFIRQKKTIRHLRIVLDYKATNKTLILWPFIAQTVEHCFLADNHSKILYVHNESHRVVVVMSQNLTRGNRYEAGTIFTDLPAIDSIVDSLNFIIKNHSVPFADVFSRRINSD